MTEKVKLLKFGAQWCGPCQTMAKKQTLEKFSAKHPEVEIVKYDLPEDEIECACGLYGQAGEECVGDEDGKGGCGKTIPDHPKEAKEASDLADKYDVETIPTVIFMMGDEELGRSEEVVTLKELEELYSEVSE